MGETSKVRDLAGLMADRRDRAAPTVDFGAERSHGKTEGPTFTTPLGWLAKAAFHFALVGLVAAGAIMGPPLWACRTQDRTGFFAGDSFGACAGRGISERFDQLEGRLKAFVQRSGR